MRYTKPELTATRPALALVQMQTPASKCGTFLDRADLQAFGPYDCIVDPAAYEGDE